MGNSSESDGQILFNCQEYDGSFRKQRLRKIGEGFLGALAPKIHFSSAGSYIWRLFDWIKEHTTAKSAAPNPGGAEEKLKHLWNSSWALILQTSPRACNTAIVGKQELFIPLTAGGRWSPHLRHLPHLNLGCLGLGCRRGGMAEPWRLLQCHTPGKSILAPKIPSHGTALIHRGGGEENSATKSLLCSLIFI